MSKKDYLLIAQAIADTWAEVESQRAIAESIATALEKDNPLFNRQRFLAACGINYN